MKETYVCGRVRHLSPAEALEVGGLRAVSTPINQWENWA
jgi:hypothetical protein